MRVPRGLDNLRATRHTKPDKADSGMCAWPGGDHILLTNPRGQFSVCKRRLLEQEEVLIRTWWILLPWMENVRLGCLHCTHQSVCYLSKSRLLRPSQCSHGLRSHPKHRGSATLSHEAGRWPKQRPERERSMLMFRFLPLEVKVQKQFLQKITE